MFQSYTEEELNLDCSIGWIKFIYMRGYAVRLKMEVFGNQVVQ